MTMNVNDLIEWLKQNCQGDETVFIETERGWIYPGEDKLGVQDWAEVEYGTVEVGLGRIKVGGCTVPWRLPLPSHIQQEVDGTINSQPPVNRVTRKRYLVISTEGADSDPIY